MAYAAGPANYNGDTAKTVGEVYEMEGLQWKGDIALADYQPNAEELLLIFQQASVAHRNVTQAVGARLNDAINAKNGMSAVSTELQSLRFGENGLANGDNVIAALQNLHDTTTDPEAKAQIATALAIAKNGGDNQIAEDEKKKIDTIVSNTTDAIDARMQLQTMRLKQQTDYFNSLTAVIKEIMDGNTKVFNTIMGR